MSPPPLLSRPRFALVLTALLAALLVAVAPADAARAAGAWQWPVDPARVVHAFDSPDNPWESGHRGVDLAASIGQAVRAPADGSVTFAGVIAGRGVVVVSHGAVRTTYEPVEKSVTVGALVHAGDALGTLQAFAHHCSSPCLHWGAIQGETYLDPTSFIVPRPSRLLPLWGDAPRLPDESLGTGSTGSAATPDAQDHVDQQPPVPSDRSALPGTATEPDVPVGIGGDLVTAAAIPRSFESPLTEPPAPEADGSGHDAGPGPAGADRAHLGLVRSAWLLPSVLLASLAISLAGRVRPRRRSRSARGSADPL